MIAVGVLALLVTGLVFDIARVPFRFGTVVMVVIWLATWVTAQRMYDRRRQDAF